MRHCRHICQESKKRRNSSFTLVELLITASIFAVVSIAIYATFNSGMTVWRRAKDANTEGRNVFLKTEKLGRELRQAFSSSDIVFKADKEKIQFPSVVDSDICRIIYSYDENQKILFRSCDKLADILAKEKKELEPKFFAYISGIDKLNFSYLFFDVSKNGYVWKDDWQLPSLPKAVKLNLTVKGKVYATTIIIPTA